MTNKVILVVDDSTTIRKSAEVFLKTTGHQILMAENGYEALTIIGQSTPDLIFLDIVMPRLDGYDTCTLIKMHDSYKKIPVVMLSSKEGLFDQAKAALAGSNEYMTKPFTRDEITEVVKKHLG